MAKEIGVHERALGLLAVRDHGRVELARKLRRKGCAAAEVDDVVGRLVEAGVLDDAAVVEREVDRLAREGRGPLMVRQKLAKRGFDGGTIGAAIDRAEEDGRFAEACREALRRRFGASDPTRGDDGAPDRKGWLRAARFLAGRGFRESTVRQALRGD